MAKEARAAAGGDLSPAASEAAAAPDAHSEREKISADDVFSLGELSELRDVFAGESGDGIPLSMWEQLAGMFEETQGAPEEPPPLAPLPRLQLPAFFESEHLDVDLPFDGGMGAPPAPKLSDRLLTRAAAVDDWRAVALPTPVASEALSELEARGAAGVQAALRARGVAADGARAAALRAALDGLLAADDREAAWLRVRRDAEADMLLPGAYAALQFCQPWRDCLADAFRCVLKAHGLTGAWEARRAGAAAAGADGPTPFQRAQALHVAALRDRASAALEALDGALCAEADKLDALQAAGKLPAARALLRLPSAARGGGIDGPSVASMAWAAAAAEAKGDDFPAGSDPRGARCLVTERLDVRLASRADALRRMAMRAFVMAAQEALAPAAHPEARAALLPAKPAAAKAAPPAAGRELLRAWMRAHILPSESHPHGPFPSAEEKAELARQAGLSTSQVADWFVNARARWWKPLVEGMSRGLAEAAGEGAAEEKAPPPPPPPPKRPARKAAARRKGRARDETTDESTDEEEEEEEEWALKPALRATRRRSASFAPQTYDEVLASPPVTRREHVRRRAKSAAPAGCDDVYRQLAPAGAESESEAEDVGAAIDGLGLTI